ncbi:MAG: hypothetical protein ABI373_05535, partial [Flavobacteriales bacterium]
MNGRTFRPLLLILAAVLLVQACQKEPEPPRWDLNVTAPLVKTSLTINDLLPDSILSTDADGNVSIVFTSELFTLSLDTILNAPDTSFQYAYAVPVPGPVPVQPGVTFNSTDNVTHFDLQDLSLSELIVRSGQVDIKVTSRMNGNILGNFSLPGATLNGVPFAAVQALPPGTPANPSVTQTSRALDGYVFDMTGPNHNAVNTLATHLSYSSDPNGPAFNVTNQDSLLSNVSYHDIIAEYATGSFGTRNIQVDSTSSGLGLFDNITGSLSLDQVTAQLQVHNGIGVDAQAHIHFIRSVNSTTGITVALIAPITAGPVNLDRALDLNGSFQSALNTFDLNAGNSNIKPFVENLPSQIDYAMDVTINPLGDISNGHDFFYNSSKLIADLAIDIPLRLSATGLTLQKTLAVDLPGSSDQHALQNGTLHLFADNGFPFSAVLDLDIVDAQGNILSQLTSGQAIASGTLGTDGIVSSSSATRLDMIVSPEQIDLFHTGGRLHITAVFNTADQPQHVQLRSNYSLDLQLTTDANYIV